MSQPRDEDFRLLDRALAGESEAFEEIFRKYRDKIYRIAYGYMLNKDDALDVTQETFVKAYENLDSFKKASSLFTWLCQIAINQAIDLRRKKSRRRTVQLEESVPAESNSVTSTTGHPLGIAEEPSRAAEEKELQAQFMSALEELSEKHRSVFLLHTVEGLSYREIADTLGIAIGTVMSRLFYARQRLQARLKGEAG